MEEQRPLARVPALVRRSDGFSEQFSLPDDTHFWIRIEMPISDALLISDFSLGALSEYDGGMALIDALAQCGQIQPRKITFLALGSEEDDSVAETMIGLDGVIEAYVSRRRMFVSGKELATKRGKVSVSYQFHSFERG
ncbi:hypothetical protein C1J03_18570 [Sulfitobacter sp. SK012]|uniref:hypothetical protein n=1 Tax=Sulfitobacter sp. SK012 TaxID=1389005 RepID=UPI000E0CA430|nr:hypothetical protein [Sulfitobacter sp. SK012]AXI47838.1 hypothetical protein C1J03_18570 [Sulfitobacter sp. SK012]